MRDSVWTSAAAWALSIAIHAGLLGGLGRLSIQPGATAKEGAPPARISVEQIRRMIRTEPVISRPMTSPTTELRPVQSAPIAERALEKAVESAASQDAAFPEESFEPRMEFFGHKTQARRLAFVVDCSGSMFGRMELVKSQLRQSIASLKPDQFFSVLFFSGNGQTVESGGGQLRRATASQKQKALAMVESVTPGGRTQALPALKRALELREPSRRQVEVIYFLTDGFDLDESAVAVALLRYVRLRSGRMPRSIK